MTHNNSNVTRALERVEEGEAGLAEATVLREALALATIQRIAHPRIGVQKIVAQGIRARGYRDGWNDGEFAARQIVKVLEELAELAGQFDLPFEWIRYGEQLNHIANQARAIFDDVSLWGGAGLDFEVSLDDILEEIADVMIPLFALADVLGGDALAVVERKVVRDVARGVRK